MTSLSQWAMQVAAILLLAVAFRTMMSGWMRHDFRKMLGGIVGCMIASVFVSVFASGGLDTVRGWVIGSGHPDKPSNPADDGGSTFPFPWSAFLGYLGLAAACIAAGFGIRFAARWYRRRKKAQRANEEQLATVARRREALEADHSAIREEYGTLRASLEWLDVLALDDVTVRQTADFLNAMYAADDEARGENLDAYRDTVSHLRLTWKAALTHARKQGTAGFSPTERDAIGRARKLLARARDGSGSEHEQYADLAKAKKLLAGIAELPTEAVASLEGQHRLSLTKGGERRA